MQVKPKLRYTRPICDLILLLKINCVALTNSRFPYSSKAIFVGLYLPGNWVFLHIIYQNGLSPLFRDFFLLVFTIVTDSKHGFYSTDRSNPVPPGLSSLYITIIFSPLHNITLPSHNYSHLQHMDNPIGSKIYFNTSLHNF